MRLLLLWIMLFSSAAFSYEFKSVDGVMIKAVEEYPSVKKNEFSLGVTYLPAHSYYHGVGINAGFARYFNKRWGWEVLNLNMVFAVEKSTTTQLVEKYGRQPEKLEKAEYILSSNLKYVLSYGKSIFFKEYIRLTRLELIGGFGSIATNEQNYLSINLGIQFDFVVSEDFSWKFEVIDYFTPQQDTAEPLDYLAGRLQLAWRFK